MIHDYDTQYQAEKQRLAKSDISDKNKELIAKFEADLLLEGLSKPRLIRYMSIMRLVAKRLKKDFDKAKIPDLKRVVGAIQSEKYSPHTKEVYKVMIRRFYKWLKGTKHYPEIVEWISIRMSRSEKKLPSEGDLLTEDDIEKLLNVANHPRDKALVAVLWESGARMGEIGNLIFQNVKFDKHGVQITVQGKTGSRKIRLISSTPYLSTWMNAHPFRTDQKAPLWINIGTTNHNQPMRYENFRKMLKILFERAGIQKRSNPHLFRHSRATFMAHHLTEFQMNQYFGWIQGSDMPSTYVHMSGKEVEKAIMTMNGITLEDEKEESKMQPQICPRCENINAHDSKHCSKCGGILDLHLAVELSKQETVRGEADKLMNALFKDKDVQNLILEKIASLDLRVNL
ncbi:MAG: tyrosine-type recombinase/integrase [Candidatus Nanoarchaeia archaeon]